jgi:hypothetical protein
VGPNASGPATATHPSGGRLNGTISGGINGHSVDFTITWDNGPVGHYTGTVGDDAVARGDTVDVVHPENKAKWNTAFPIGCLTTADPPAAPPPPPKDQPPPLQEAPPDRVLAKVNAPVDVYNGVNVPKGAATRLGELGTGDVVAVWGVCGDTPDQVQIDARPSVLTQNKWCYVQGAPVPDGKGYIWGHLDPQ